ncbi:MAG: oxygen-independent coproporphyrinogen III oxidase [Alphaproteobacteria bacterium]
MTLLAKYDRGLPRYTSYPTAPHFHAGVGPETYGAWLGALDPSEPVSIYLHVPFCRELCWFCGCTTKIVRRTEVFTRYAGLLRREIDLVTDRLPGRFRVGAIHWGGGTPLTLAPSEFLALSKHLGDRFAHIDETETAVEIDPRILTPEQIAALVEAGVGRASLGVQDFDPEVQRAVNRVQPYDVTARAVASLREAGVASINLDLMYGLPLQTVAGLVETARRAAGLQPQRIALFGYAHVPWMKRHQRLIDERLLPDLSERLRQFEAASACLVERGYVRIGLDHFALPGDAMARAAEDGRLRRNFQGYTSDPAPVLLGLGASAISTLPQGYVQNSASLRAYGEAVSSGRSAVRRGIVVDQDDLLRREVIERLMCEMRVDLARICERHGKSPAYFAPEWDRLAALERDGLIIWSDHRIEVSERSLVRAVCAAFDSYLGLEGARHSMIV